MGRELFEVFGDHEAVQLCRRVGAGLSFIKDYGVFISRGEYIWIGKTLAEAADKMDRDLERRKPEETLRPKETARP